MGFVYRRMGTCFRNHQKLDSLRSLKDARLKAISPRLKAGVIFMARPQIPIDYKKVEEYAQFCDSEEEIALALGISYSTLKRRKADSELFEQAIKRGKAKANVFVGGRLMQKIREGDTASTIFYLKTRCGWRETQKIEADVTTKEKAPEGMTEMYAWLAKVRAPKAKE